MPGERREEREKREGEREREEEREIASSLLDEVGRDRQTDSGKTLFLVHFLLGKYVL